MRIIKIQLNKAINQCKSLGITDTYELGYKKGVKYSFYLTQKRGDKGMTLKFWKSWSGENPRIVYFNTIDDIKRGLKALGY